MKTYETIGPVRVDFSGECLGCYGREGERTVVRHTACGRFAVLTARKPYRIIKLLDTERHARAYNVKIHS